MDVTRKSARKWIDSLSLRVQQALFAAALTSSCWRSACWRFRRSNTI
ncbi:MAG: hypothetical protein ACLUI3_10825 [Christensenellales bacterium]